MGRPAVLFSYRVPSLEMGETKMDHKSTANTGWTFLKAENDQAYYAGPNGTVYWDLPLDMIKQLPRDQQNEHLACGLSEDEYKRWRDKQQ